MKFLLAFFHNFFCELMGTVPDRYVPIEVAPQAPAQREPSEGLRKAASEMGFGKDTEKFVMMAVANHATEVSQIKWLRSISLLRNTKRGWMLDSQFRVSKVVPA